MKLTKKLLAMVLVIALSLATMSLAFAHEHMTAGEQAEVLNELGLFLGVDEEVFTPNLEGATDRAAAMVMVARALDWVNAEDFDEAAVSGFEDVPAWAEPHVAYAVEMEITFGVGDNLFGNDLPVTERQLQTWFDRALGKGDTWEDNADLDNVTPLIRADLVSGTWDTLMETPVGAEETLIETIVGDDDDMMYSAIVGGLIEPRDVEIDPDDYDVTIDDVAMGYYLSGDTLEVTLRGLEPFTEQKVSFLIHHGGPPWPFLSPILEEADEDGNLMGIVAGDGSLTVSGVLLEDLPEGPIVATVPGYGIGIDNTMNLMFGERTVTFGMDEDDVKAETIVFDAGEEATIAVGEFLELGEDLVILDQYNHPYAVEGEWESSDEAVASVDADGTVEGLSVGVAIVTFTTEDGASADFEVTVTE